MVIHNLLRSIYYFYVLHVSFRERESMGKMSYTSVHFQVICGLISNLSSHSHNC